MSSDEFAANYDYVMVFPTKEVDGKYEQTERSRVIVSDMLHAGLEVFPYYSVQGDELICLIRCPVELLKKFADTTDYEMELSPVEIEKAMRKGDAEAKISPREINDKPEFSPLSPYVYIFGKYDTELPQELYKAGPQGSAFKESVRLKLIYYLLKAPSRQGGCRLPIAKSIKKGEIKAFYPMHLRDRGPSLKAAIMSMSRFPWNMPFDDIKEYFGEKVALYFRFLGVYTQFLLFPGIVGLALQLVVWGTGDFASPVLPFFSVFICLWSITMLEYWKREEAMTGMRWGMLDFESKEPDRPEYHGAEVNSPITGEKMTYFPPASANSRAVQSLVAIGGMILLVVGVVASIYVLRFAVQNTLGTYASLLASVLNTIQITIFNIVYGDVAVRLTGYENHRTDTEYEDGLIAKLFMFQFVNSYASFFFLAFIAQYLTRPDGVDSTFKGQCGATNCMQPLSINLAIIFGSRITITNALNVVLPYHAFRSKFAAETKGADVSKFTTAEKDYVLMPYNVMLESIQNYADTAIQYGFMTLFITALPYACIFSALSNYIKNKLDAWKLFTVSHSHLTYDLLFYNNK